MATMTFPATNQAAVFSQQESDEMMERDVCVLHDAVFQELKSAVADIRWIARFGKWFMTVLGATMLLTAGFTVSLLTHVMMLNTRISVVEQQFQESARDRAALREFDRKLEDRMMRVLDDFHKKQP